MREQNKKNIKLSILNLDKLLKSTLKDCGKNPSKEFINQEFLTSLGEKGQAYIEEVFKDERANNI